MYTDHRKGRYSITATSRTAGETMACDHHECRLRGRCCGGAT
jgi:hypothetical protein